MSSICLPPGRWGLSEPDGVLHHLGPGRRALCGVKAKALCTRSVPPSLPRCPQCLPSSVGQNLPPAPSQARQAVNRLLACR